MNQFLLFSLAVHRASLYINPTVIEIEIEIVRL